MKNLFSRLENMMTAITFAEANCPEIALEYADAKARPRARRSATPLGDFMSSVGLEGVRVHYGVVNA
ncbi:MAG: hypothetical protein ACLFOY_12740 [Desulfatibacillaceae bacterium]